MTAPTDTEAVERFCARYATVRGSYAGIDADCSAFAEGLPRVFVALLTHARIERIAGLDLHVGPVGDWLAHARERHLVMQSLADGLGNPSLADMVPFGDTSQAFEVALERVSGHVVWLDPSRYDCGNEAVIAVVGESVEAWLEAMNAAVGIAPTGDVR